MMIERRTLEAIAVDKSENAQDRVDAASALLNARIAEGMNEESRLDRRARLAMFVVTWATAWLAFVLLMCCSCAARPHTRTIGEEHHAALEIVGACPGEVMGLPALITQTRGSAVIVSSSQVLTAFHVVDDPACMYSVEYPDASRVAMRVEAVWQPLDVARLVTVTGTFKEPPILGIGVAPLPGATVCIVSAIPHYSRTCGDVQWYGGTKDKAGDMRHTALTQPGNSGAGVYDAAGLLVGILTHYGRCINGQFCGGRATSIRPEFFQ